MAAFGQRESVPDHIAGITVHAVALLFLLSGSLRIRKTIRIPKP